MKFRFLQSLFTAAPGQAGQFDKSLILKAIERVVDGTDPRLRAVSHYRRQLWDAVEHALDYVVTFVNTLPPASVVDHTLTSLTLDCAPCSSHPIICRRS